MPDPREGKSVKVANITVETIFQNFESLLLVDNGATDGFTITDDAGNVASWPTGIPLSIGGPGAKPSSYIKVTAATGKALNVSYVLYQ
jgi:hypothetical protein